MGRDITDNRFANAGKVLIASSSLRKKMETTIEIEGSEKKDSAAASNETEEAVTETGDSEEKDSVVSPNETTETAIEIEDSEKKDSVAASNETEEKVVKSKTSKKKDKVVTAKVYPDTWAIFTAINKAQGMTNNSVINMLISEYVRNKKEILK